MTVAIQERGYRSWWELSGRAGLLWAAPLTDHDGEPTEGSLFFLQHRAHHQSYWAGDQSQGLTAKPELTKPWVD